jgi:nitric oxide reductase NorE protein
MSTSAFDAERTLEPARAQRRVPGEVGIWAFILTDFAVFSAYFVTIVFERAMHDATFARGTASLSPAHGAVSTFLMVTASLFVALAVQRARAGEVTPARRLLVGSAACGALFVLNKATEWHSLLSAGHQPNDDHFYGLYYMLTGLHLLHVLVAMAVVGYLWRAVGQIQLAPTRKQLRFVENGASYWHLVDLIWIVLFALFYLAR